MAFLGQVLQILSRLALTGKARLAQRCNPPALAAICLALVLLGAAAVPVQANPAAPALEEYEAKAAFVFNFAKFIHWPETRALDEDLCIGVVGDNPFGTHILQLQGSRVAGRSIVVAFPATVADLLSCDLLFISASESPRLEALLGALVQAPVLTVGDMEGFAARGGMIEMYLRDNRIRFRINLEAARAAGLDISSRLLQLASNAEELMREQRR
ncbi:YfiR family protein [Geoalkalibacter halelectricus]|uniref:YfiR family protein n=1 Tax=Geoalkalibacter halelectricus TaxID=2847045 RepID=A0ABY5ZPM8_9BACT|nr:YfiR family protein [Geoalkalibacter halelectricus]UWZ79912.1 YfiR family protein [Geoalkalibacter halelectricus]